MSSKGPGFYTPYPQPLSLVFERNYRTISLSQTSRNYTKAIHLLRLHFFLSPLLVYPTSTKPLPDNTEALIFGTRKLLLTISSPVSNCLEPQSTSRPTSRVLESCWTPVSSCSPKLPLVKTYIAHFHYPT